jgi:hypothetical protein
MSKAPNSRKARSSRGGGAHQASSKLTNSNPTLAIPEDTIADAICSVRLPEMRGPKWFLCSVSVGWVDGQLVSGQA